MGFPDFRDMQFPWGGKLIWRLSILDERLWHRDDLSVGEANDKMVSSLDNRLWFHDDTLGREANDVIISQLKFHIISKPDYFRVV